MQFGSAAGPLDTTGLVIMAVAIALLIAVLIAAVRAVRAGPRPFRSHPTPPLVVYPESSSPIPALAPAGVRPTGDDGRDGGDATLPERRNHGRAPENEVALLAPSRRSAARVAVAGDDVGGRTSLSDGALPPAGATSDGTLQILPGRLEVLSGAELGQDIRFIRSGGGTPELTLGRGSGPPHRHIQLQAPTVSRTHARLRYERNGWSITNLSDVNPLRINGEALPPDTSRPLEEGDRLELGEVLLRFRTR